MARKVEHQEKPKSNRGRKMGFRFPPPTLHPDATKIRPNQLHLAIGLSKATGYRLRKSDPTFPALYKMTSGASCWDRAELEAWLKSRKAVVAEVSDVERA